MNPFLQIKLAFILSLIISHATFTDGIFRDEILDSVKKGDVAKISKYFDKTVNITLMNNSQTYSKSQGIMVLKDFFSNNKVLQFEIVQFSRQSDQSEFLYGNLITKRGNFRTFIMIKARGEAKLLHEIRFE